MYNGVVDLDMFWDEEKNGGKNRRHYTDYR